MVTLVRLIGAAACLIMIASFVPFVRDEAKGGTEGQINVLGGTVRNQQSQPQRSDLRRKIDDANDFLAKPFTWVTEDSDSAWVKRSVTLLLGLLVYGVGIFFLARALPGRRPKEPSFWET
jgi:hypothetical protein